MVNEETVFDMEVAEEIEVEVTATTNEDIPEKLEESDDETTTTTNTDTSSDEETDMSDMSIEEENLKSKKERPKNGIKTLSDLDIKVGMTFKSFEEAKEKVDNEAKKHFVQYFIRDSRTVSAAARKNIKRHLSNKLRIYQVKFSCIHGGRQHKVSGAGRRRKTTLRKENLCPACILLKANEKGNRLVVTKVVNEHNHCFNKKFYEGLSKQRKLDPELVKEAEQLLDLDVDKPIIRKQMQKNSGKPVTLLDIHNIANRMRKSTKKENHSPKLDKLTKKVSNQTLPRTIKIDKSKLVIQRNHPTLAMKHEGSGPVLKDVEGMPLTDIVKKLENIVPLSLAESWDNVGLLLEPKPDSHVHNILLTIDVDERTLNIAKEYGVQLIIGYHPLLFRGVKTLTQSISKDRVIMSLIQSNISVYSPHTSWDAMEKGVNDWLLSHLEVKDVRPILVNQSNSKLGMGRIGTLAKPLTISEILSKTSTHCSCNPSFAYARGCDGNSLINSVAVCAGSGGSVLKGAKADLYLTGEMSHHEILDATQNGTSVILTNHSNSERGFLQFFVDNFSISDKVNVFVEPQAKDPLQVMFKI